VSTNSTARVKEHPEAVRKAFLVAKKSPQRHEGTEFLLRLTPGKSASYRESFALNFHRETGVSVIEDSIEGINSNSLILSCGEEISETLRLHTAICRLLEVNPADYGLKSDREKSGFAPWSSTEGEMALFNDAVSFYAYGAVSNLEEKISKDFIKKIPPEQRMLGYFWHASKNSTLEFGAPVLVPSSCLDPDIDEPTEGWAIQLRGLEDEQKPIAVAAWDDLPGIERLISQVKSLTPEAALSLVMLSSDAISRWDIRDRKMRYEQKLLRPVATQEWNAETMAIRPVLVRKAIASLDEDLASLLPKLRGRRTPGFWHSDFRTADVLDEADNTKADKEIARRISFSGEVPQATVRQVASLLQAQLDKRELGTAVIANGLRNAAYVFVVKDVEYFTRFAPLFGATSVIAI